MAKSDDGSLVLVGQKPQLANKFCNHAHYTPLNTQLEKNFALRHEKFINLTPMKADMYLNMTKYCAFHKDHSHLTSEMQTANETNSRHHLSR